MKLNELTVKISLRFVTNETSKAFTKSLPHSVAITISLNSFLKSSAL